MDRARKAGDVLLTYLKKHENRFRTDERVDSTSLTRIRQGMLERGVTVKKGADGKPTLRLPFYDSGNPNGARRARLALDAILAGGKKLEIPSLPNPPKELTELFKNLRVQFFNIA